VFFNGIKSPAIDWSRKGNLKKVNIHTSNCFAVECLIDEIAAATKRDPYELRCDLLVGSPRLFNEAIIRGIKTLICWPAAHTEMEFKGCHLTAISVNT